MRKILYFSIFLLGALQAKAQENRGFLIPAKVIKSSVMVGGSVAGAYSRVTDTRNGERITGDRQKVALDGKVGYFVWDDVALGVRAAINHDKVKMDKEGGITSTTLLGGPFVRYFFDNGIFTEASAAAGKNNQPNRVKTDIAELRAGVGYAIFINPKVAIEPALLVNYYQEVRKTEKYEKMTEIGPLLNIGVQVYLFRERRFKL